ncbi:MAG: hypothetical protein Pars2KO_29800 [Parasphingorhabdus sp.]
MPETRLSAAAPSSLMDYVSEHGSYSSPYLTKICNDYSILNSADVADIAHFFCALHGRHPGVVDHASTKTTEEAARDWFVTAMDGFASERGFLTKLTVSAGPISGVSANDQSNATLEGQRKALDMLSQSDRNGCALGASFALVLDWHSIRTVLEQIALKLDVEPRQWPLPSVEVTELLNTRLCQTPTMKRAINFGVDQILSQHRGLWQLLEARRKVRADG